MQKLTRFLFVSTFNFQLLTFNLLYAMGQSPAGKGGASKGGGLGGFFPLILIFLIFYFLLIRPQQKRTKEHRKTLQEIKRGDRVVTSGGIHGQIKDVKGSLVEIEIAPNVKVTVTKSLISQVLKPSENAPVSTIR